MIHRMGSVQIDARELREMVRDVLDREATPERVRAVIETPDGHDPALHSVMAELGWTGLATPEAYGGTGATLLELGILLEELGRCLAATSFMPSVVLFGGGLLLAGRGDQQAALLPRLVSGDLLATVALGGAAGRCGPESLALRAEERGASLVLEGTADYVPHAELAEFFLVAARTRGGATVLVVLDPREGALEIAPQPLFDPTRRLSRVSVRDFEVPRESVLGDPAAARTTGEAVRGRLLDLAAIAIACDCRGGAARVLESTVAYMMERRQFDRVIASFQALKHRCVDMFMRVEASAVSVMRALEAFAREQADARVAASEAKFYASDSYVHVAQEGLQMHGGVGFTWEYDSHLFLKRALLNRALMGDSRWHQERAADGVLGPVNQPAPGRNVSQSADMR